MALRDERGPSAPVTPERLLARLPGRRRYRGALLGDRRHHDPDPLRRLDRQQARAGLQARLRTRLTIRLIPNGRWFLLAPNCWTSRAWGAPVAAELPTCSCADRAP